MMLFTKDETKLANLYVKLTEEERRLLISIMYQVEGREDRREAALNWKGEMKDLPAALAQI